MKFHTRFVAIAIKHSVTNISWKSLFACFGLSIFIGIIAGTADATPIFTGTRSTASTDQIIADDEWKPTSGGFKVTFTVEWTGSYWSYDYVFRNKNGDPLDPAITRFLKLQVSDVSGSWYKLISDGHTAGYSTGQLIPLTPALLSFHLWDAPASDPSYSLYSIYIGDNNDSSPDELSDGHVTILSSQGPKWGSFYARDGDPYGQYTGPAEAINRGFNGGDFPHPAGGPDYTGPLYPPSFDPDGNMNGSAVKPWILVPDTFVLVPEPSTVVLLSSLALFILFCQCRWRSD